MKNLIKALLIVGALICGTRLPASATVVVGGTAPTGAITNITQTVTGSGSGQAVTVQSTVGCVIGGYAYVADSLPEPVVITTISPGVSITGVFTNNHSVGASLICSLATPGTFSGSVTVLMPFTGAADTQTPGANQAVGCDVYNRATGVWDRCTAGPQLGSLLTTIGAWLTDGCASGCTNFFNAAATPYVVKAAAGIYYGLQNVTASNQTATITVYDNASACSGKILDQQLLYSGQTELVAGTAGKQAANGVTVCTTGAAVGNGVEAMYQ